MSLYVAPLQSPPFLPGIPHSHVNRSGETAGSLRCTPRKRNFRPTYRTVWKLLRHRGKTDSCEKSAILMEGNKNIRLTDSSPHDGLVSSLFALAEDDSVQCLTTRSTLLAGKKRERKERKSCRYTSQEAGLVRVPGMGSPKLLAK